MAMETMAFLQFGGRGDILMATPILRRALEMHPYHRVTWLCLDEYAPVIKDHPLIDSYIAWPLEPGIDRRRQEHARWSDIKRYASNNFDLFCMPQHYPEHMEFRPGMHLIDHMFMNAGLEPVYPRHIEAAHSLADEIRVEKLLKSWDYEGFVCMNQVSTCTGDIWPDAYFEKLALMLKTEGIGVFSADRKLEHSIHHTGSWGEWRYLISRAKCYIGGDSGPTWLAASTDTPQIAIRHHQVQTPFFVTSFAKAKVKDKFVEILGEPSPDEVMGRIKELIR